MLHKYIVVFRVEGRPRAVVVDAVGPVSAVSIARSDHGITGHLISVCQSSNEYTGVRT